MALGYVCTSCFDWLHEGGEWLVWSWEEIGQSYEKSGQPWAGRGRFLPTHSNAAADLETEAYLATQSCLSMLYLKRFETLSYLKKGAVKIDDDLLNLEKKPCFKNYSQTLTATRVAIVVQTFSQRKYLEIAPLACLQKNGENPPLLALASLLAKKREKIGENPLLAACTHSFANLLHNQQQSSLLDRVGIFLCSTKWYILTPTAKTWLHRFWKVTSLYEWAKHSFYTSTLLSMDILN